MTELEELKREADHQRQTAVGWFEKALAAERREVELQARLEVAAAWFDEYAALHAQKLTPDGEEKAARNSERARYLRQPIHRT